MNKSIVSQVSLKSLNRPIYKRMSLHKKDGDVHARVSKKSIRRLFSEIRRQDNHFKSIGG